MLPNTFARRVHRSAAERQVRLILECGHGGERLDMYLIELKLVHVT